jgi:hydrogenase expression/formation protein HypC
MCLAIPGELISIEGDDPLLRSGRVRFGAVERVVSLACLPEAEVGDFVIVHVGMAISVVDPEEAERVFGYLDEAGVTELVEEPEGATLEPEGEA